MRRLSGNERAKANVTSGPILVVDDHEGLRRAVVRLLQAGGREAASFASGEELLESKECRRAACLILDVRLPGLSGFELRARLVHEGCHAPVIYVTAHDDPAARARAARENAAFLLKPVARERLLAAIARALGES
jgi:FixJ family two-component response regulator